MHSDVVQQLVKHHGYSETFISDKIDEVERIFLMGAKAKDELSGQDYLVREGMNDTNPELFFQIAFQLIAALYSN